MVRMLTDPSPTLLVSAIERNVESAFRLLASCHPGVEIFDTPSIMRFVTDVQHPMANGVLRAQLEEEGLDEGIRAIVADYKERRLPMMWFVGPNSKPANLDETLLAAGSSKLGDIPGMAADLSIITGGLTVPDGVQLVEVECPEALAEWQGVLETVFKLPASVAGMFAGIAKVHGFGESSPFRNYIAYLNGVAVATSSLFISDGVAGLYCVGTLPDARRKGIGGAITLMPMLEAKRLGCRFAILQSAPAGMGVYRQLGFRSYCQFQRHTFNLEAMP